MKVIVGLGNPGLQYQSTRHNVGFRVLDRLGTALGATFSDTKRLKADIAKLTVASDTVLLVKPTTFMNLSGVSFVAVLQWYKVPLSDFLVIHDDVSLRLGRLRFQKGGGAGGQHGIESIIESLQGEKNFDRLKIGVGPDPGGWDRAEYVLSPVPELQEAVLENVMNCAQEGAMFWREHGIDQAMNIYNGIDLSESIVESLESTSAESIEKEGPEKKEESGETCDQN